MIGIRELRREPDTLLQGPDAERYRGHLAALSDQELRPYQRLRPQGRPAHHYADARHTGSPVTRRTTMAEHKTKTVVIEADAEAKMLAYIVIEVPEDATAEELEALDEVLDNYELPYEVIDGPWMNGFSIGGRGKGPPAFTFVRGGDGKLVLAATTCEIIYEQNEQE
jgi:hypothetical protein